MERIITTGKKPIIAIDRLNAKPKAPLRERLEPKVRVIDRLSER